MTQPSNPTGIVLTQQHLDDSFKESYWDHAVRSGAFYYIAGRCAVLAGFMAVHANILHHAVEMFLKAILAKGDTAVRIREYGNQRRGYGHSLGKLWQDVKTRYPARAQDFAAHDATVAALDKFEDIRYPEALLATGAQITINIHDVPPMPSAGIGPSVPTFELSLPAIDRLMAFLFQLTNYNPDVLRDRLGSDHAITYHNLHNTAPMLTLTAQVSGAGKPAGHRTAWSHGWLKDLAFLLAGAVIALGIAYYYGREASRDAARQLSMLRTLLVTAEEKGDVELDRNAKGEITGGRVIRLQGGATVESSATGDLTTGPGPTKPVEH